MKLDDAERERLEIIFYGYDDLLGWALHHLPPDSISQHAELVARFRIMLWGKADGKRQSKPPELSLVRESSQETEAPVEEDRQQPFHFD